eukprot:GHVL01037882.1.p1 GENE.GHVL01037882.1~~GHVL01037882.1.p1  ORF type:complete len:138 (+),score=18.77 GHVL01037882.1:232-645(+)
MVNNICMEIVTETTTSADEETTEMTSEDSSLGFETATGNFSTSVEPDVTLGPVKTNFTLAEQEMSLGFIGTCSPHDAEVHQAIRVHLLDRLEELDLCAWAVCRHGNVSISCAPPPPRRRTYDLSTFELSWNVSLQNR